MPFVAVHRILFHSSCAIAIWSLAAKKDPIVPGNSKVADGGLLRRPEFFSVGDVAVFEEHEARLAVLSKIPKGEDLAFTAALHELPEKARDLLAVPVPRATARACTELRLGRE